VKAFFDMGGYAAFVWPSFIVTFVVLALNVWSARSSRRRAIEEIKRKQLLDQHESEA